MVVDDISDKGVRLKINGVSVPVEDWNKYVKEGSIFWKQLNRIPITDEDMENERSDVERNAPVWEDIPVTWYDSGFWGQGYVTKIISKNVVEYRDIKDEKSHKINLAITNSGYFQGHVDYTDIEYGTVFRFNTGL